MDWPTKLKTPKNNLILLLLLELQHLTVGFFVRLLCLDMLESFMPLLFGVQSATIQIAALKLPRTGLTRNFKGK